MKIETYCNGNVMIAYDFFTPEETKRVSEWMRSYEWDKLPVNPVRFWKQRLFNLSSSNLPGLENSFEPVNDIAPNLVQRIIDTLNLVRQTEWKPNPVSFIKMWPGSNPTGDTTVEMFYHIDNQRHMPQPIIWGAVIYPNDNYEGGEISYPEYGFKYKPVAGSVVFHSGDTKHGVELVTSGERYCITSLVTEEGVWNENPLPTPTNNPNAEPFIYPMGYWGKRMTSDPIREDVKIYRPDGTTAPYQADPESAVKAWEQARY
jgi:hypothetical protein